jgi:hypothetical protein
MEEVFLLTALKFGKISQQSNTPKKILISHLITTCSMLRGYRKSLERVFK